MIRVEGLTKRFGATLAVDDLWFTVEPGKVTGFLGPNGAGRSTALQLMLGLVRGGGRTLFDGRPYQALACPMRVVGAVLEARAFHPHRSARDHLRMLAAAARVPDRRVDQVLDEVGLAPVAHRRAGGFSLGMAQRLGLAAALLAEPRALVLDEPANGLDPHGLAWLRTLLRAHADNGRAVLVSSHLLAEMQLLAHHLLASAFHEGGQQGERGSCGLGRPIVLIAQVWDPIGGWRPRGLHVWSGRSRGRHHSPMPGW